MAMLVDAIAEQVAAKVAEMTAALQVQPVEPAGLYTITTATKYLGIGERTLRTLVADGAIGHRRVKKLVRFTQQDLDTYIEKKAKRPARF